MIEMGLLDVLTGRRHYERIEEKLEDIVEMLKEHDMKSSAQLDVILNAMDTLMPEEKGRFINRIEERIVAIKKDMVSEAILSECLEDMKSYPELKRRVKARTGLSFTNAFFDNCLRRLMYEGKLDRVGRNYVTVKKRLTMADLTQEDEIAEALSQNDGKIDSLTLVQNGEAEEVAPGDGRNLRTKLEAGGEAPSNNGAKRLDATRLLMELIEDMEKEMGSAPIEALLEEGERRGVDRETLSQIIDEHLMVTGQLYEPRRGHVKLVR